jgi:two-component system, cell cycle sensor histidine kinase and response regulator CckA
MSLSPLRLLLVEDSPSDARLILHELRQAGFEAVPTRVETEADFVAALGARPDVILCDYNLPQFDATSALAIARERLPDVPFLIVSGSIGEETAVEVMKLGATDYLLKDRLGRLGRAVRQALEEKQLREAERRGREALRVSEEQYRLLADGIPQIVWTARPDGSIDYLNRRAAEYSGLETESLTGRKCARAVHPDDRPHVEAVWGEALRSGMPCEFEFRLRRADGAYRWHVGRQVAIRNDAGAISRWFGTCTDIHDQKMIAEQRARDALLLASVRDSVIVTDLEGVVTYWNEGAARLFGWSAEEMIGRPYADRFPEPVRSRIVAQIRERLSGSEWNGEFEDYRKDGSRVWIDSRVTRITNADGRPVGVMGVSHDISERKRHEAVHRFQHALLESQAEASPDGILLVGTDHQILSHNRQFLNLWGIPTDLTATEDGAATALTASLVADPEAFTARIAAINAAPDSRSHDEVLLADGRTLDRYSGPIRTAGGERLGRVWFFRDITDRKRVEASLGAVMRSVADAIITVDEAGVIDSANPAVEPLFGYTEAEVIGLPVRTLLPEPFGDDRDPGSPGAGLAKVIGIGREVTGRRKDGSRFPADLSVSECRLHGARHFTGVVRDVTAKKKLEDQFRQAQKMEAFGQLAGGVAHDFNNLLTVINGYSDLLLDEFAPGDPGRESMMAIREAGERAAALTAQLLAFSRKTIIEPKNLDLNAVVDSIAKMLRRLIGEDVRLSVVPGARLSPVRADLGQIEQVIMNLAVNARDAMPKGGRLTIETSNVVVKADDHGYPDGPPGRYVRLVVADTGCGMSAEVKAKLFEPFFTTKGVGKGTGLGLATVYGIVSQAGGRIGVSSEVDQGSTFTVLFPAVGEVPAPPSAPPAFPTRGSETILLVEDEANVRKLAKMALETLGYGVLEAGGGTHAAHLAETHAGPIHLLLTDVVMPTMGGRDLVDTLRARYPGLRVLYMSGYTDDAVVRYGVTQSTDAFLQKPFTPLGLARKVRAVLDAKPAE